MRKQLEILFLSEWQVGSGMGDGHLADAMLARDTDGLPFVPGRALRGALREGAWRLGRCREDLRRAEAFFWGTRSTKNQSNQSARLDKSNQSARLDKNNQPGCLRVSAARLDESLRCWLTTQPLTERENFVRDMTCRRIQTALKEKRQVRINTLRTLECGIPGLRFTAEVEADPPAGLDDAWVAHYLAAVCAAVKSMGGNRARGLGQCRLRLEGTPAAPIGLPPVQALFMGGDA